MRYVSWKDLKFRTEMFSVEHHAGNHREWKNKEISGEIGEKKPSTIFRFGGFLNLEFERTLPTNSSPKGVLSVKNSELYVFREIYAETSSKNFCIILLY